MDFGHGYDVLKVEKQVFDEEKSVNPMFISKFTSWGFEANDSDCVGVSKLMLLIYMSVSSIFSGVSASTPSLCHYITAVTIISIVILTLLIIHVMT